MNHRRTLRYRLEKVSEAIKQLGIRCKVGYLLYKQKPCKQYFIHHELDVYYPKLPAEYENMLKQYTTDTKENENEQH